MVNLDISLNTNQVAHQAGAYPCFCSMNRLAIFLYLLDGILFHRRIPTNITLAGTYVHTMVPSGDRHCES